MLEFPQKRRNGAKKGIDHTMEKKTIGSFIAALRRANGMTQKELAEKLYVSDKTVSRWECDESTPELSLIPVIADIFGITSDELLRGERKSSLFNESTPETAPPERKEKSEKSFKILLRKRLDSFKMLSWISVGLTFLGLLVAMVCNFGFLRATVGFCIGSCFIVAAVICQICFINMRYFRNDDEMFCELVNGFNYSVYKTSRKVFLVILTVFCFILPFLITGAYVGLSDDAWILMGLLFAAPLTIFAVIFSETFVFKKLVKDGIIAPTDADIAICDKKITFLKKKPPIFIIIAVVLCITIGVVINLPMFIAEPIVFNTYENFKDYMEKPMDYYDDYDTVIEYHPIYDSSDTEVLPPADNIYIYDDFDYIDAVEIKDDDGNVLCSFTPRNHSVARYTFSDTADKLPVKVYTYQAWNNACETCEIICGVLAIGIAADVLTFIVMYFAKTKASRLKG